MTYQEVLENARAVLSKNCKACPVCNANALGTGAGNVVGHPR